MIHWPTKRTEQAGDGQARSRFELIDIPDSNPYPPIEAAFPDRAAMPLRSAQKMMGSKTKDLITVLQSLIDLLQRDNETHWSKWMRVSKSRIEASDFSGVTHLLGAYGGMGSFNDLILGQSMQRGKIVWKDNQADLNEELSRLRSEAWELATYIKRSQD